MIDNNEFAFGLDISRYESSDGKLMDFKTCALYQDRPVTFVFARSTISWGYTDPFFTYHWGEIRKMDNYRADAGISTWPVGRGPYHVVYPGESATRQYDNIMRVVDPIADWKHDRIVLDLELHHNQTKRKITDTTKDLALRCHSATGHYPLLYARALWLNQYTYPQEFVNYDLWMAQYLWARPFPLFTPERQPPPDLPIGHTKWLIHQTGDKADSKPFGVDRKYYIDTNRWNGGPEVVAKYFGYENLLPIPEPEAGMYVIEMLGHLRMRTGPGMEYPDIIPEQFALRGETHHSTKRQDGWYEIERNGATGWISGNTEWTRITVIDTPPDPVPPTLTLEERVARIEQHLGL